MSLIEQFSVEIYTRTKSSKAFTKEVLIFTLLVCLGKITYLKLAAAS